jgi:hypothetical protein
MSLKDISTKFELIETIDIPHMRWICSKAVDDSIYQVVVRKARDTPFHTAYGLMEILFMSEAKYKAYIAKVKDENAIPEPF